MKLLTQNSNLKKTGIFGWTLPAHWVELSNGERFNTCPNAGACSKFCYAKTGTYMFKNVRAAHLEKLELVLYRRKEWVEMMNEEIAKKKYQGKFVRVHDGGDYFDKDYARDWILIAKSNPEVSFYSYTKQVSMFKEIWSEIPDNMTIIFSLGGKEDHLVDRSNDRHSDVFPDYDEMIRQGYNPVCTDDKKAATEGHKVGLYRNNISHVVKKLADKKFSEWQTRE